MLFSWLRDPVQRRVRPENREASQGTQTWPFPGTVNAGNAIYRHCYNDPEPAPQNLFMPNERWCLPSAPLQAAPAERPADQSRCPHRKISLEHNSRGRFVKLDV
jgi:hypothetical protein